MDLYDFETEPYEMCIQFELPIYHKLDFVKFARVLEEFLDEENLPYPKVRYIKRNRDNKKIYWNRRLK